MRALITGASGFVGRKLLKEFKNQGDEVLGTYFTKEYPDLVKLDVTDPEAVTRTIKDFQPELVIHAAAMGRPDDCQADSERAQQVNVEGTRNIVDASRRIHSTVVFISSVYVFDGKKKGPYKESDQPNPINIYGETKARAEEIVRSLSHHITLRTDMIYGYNGEGMRNGLVGVIANSQRPVLLDGKNMRQPLFLDDLHPAIMTLLNREAFGTTHLAGNDAVTQLDIGRTIEKLVRRKPIIREKTEEELISATPRPENSTMNTSRARSLGINFRGIDESLRELQGEFRELNGPEGNQASVDGKER